MAERLGEILVKEGACTPEAVRDALKNQIIFGGRLGTNLLEVRAVKEEALAHALGRQHALPALSGDLRLDVGATGLLAAEVADRCDAIPYILADRRLAVLVVDPRDLSSLDEVAFATGKAVHPIVVPEARVWALLKQTYGVDRHLRGIDVAFASLRSPPAGERERGPPPEGRGEPVQGADLMAEGDFETLYAKPTVPGAAPPVPAPPAAPAPPERGATPFGGRAPGAPPPAPPVPPVPRDEVIDLTDLLEPAPAEPAAAPPPLAPQAPPALVPEVLAALSQVPGRAPGPAAPRRREEPEPSPLGFDEAVRFLEGVDDRDAIAKTVLRYARSRFRRAVLFTVHRGAARGWAGLGEKLGAAAVRGMSLPLGSPGIVDTVVKTRSHFLGPIPKTEANVRLLKALGGGVPGNALLVPILALGRVVNVLYADAGKGALVDGSGVGELLILATRISNSYEALLERVE